MYGVMYGARLRKGVLASSVASSWGWDAVLAVGETVGGSVALGGILIAVRIFHLMTICFLP